MKTNIFKEQIKQLEFFSDENIEESELSSDFFDFFYNILDSFKKEMENPNVNDEDLYLMWMTIYSFRSFEFAKTYDNNPNKIVDFLSSLVDTNGFMNIFIFLKNKTVKEKSGYHAHQLGYLYDFFKYVQNVNNKIFLYREYYYTNNVVLNYSKVDLSSIILSSNDEDFLTSHLNEIWSYRQEDRIKLFKNNIFDIINKKVAFKSNRDNWRFNECARAILKNTPDNFLSLNIKQVEKFIDLYKIYGKNNEWIVELQRVIHIDEIIGLFQSKDGKIKNKPPFCYSAEKTLILEQILGIKFNNLIEKKSASLSNFNFNDQLWLINLCNNDITVALDLICKNCWFKKIDNKLYLEKEHKDFLSLNFEF